MHASITPMASWYYCRLYLRSTNRIIHGYGTSHYKALKDAIASISKSKY